MAQRTIATNSKSDKPRRSKAQQAVSKTPKEIQTEKRNSLAVRLVWAAVLSFLTLFLILSFFHVHAVFLDFLSNLVKGLLGYGYWFLPAALLYSAWMLVFLHQEPIRLRILSTALLTVLISALGHTIFCGITFQTGLGLFQRLWSTGMELASGGVLPGLISEGLQSMISKGGAVPLLLVLALVLVFLAFHISAAKLIHSRAEKRRQQQAELEEDTPEPVPVAYDTRADLGVLAKPMPRIRPQNEDSRRAKAPVSVKRSKPSKHTASSSDEDLLFGSSARQKREFDIPTGVDYTAQVQEMVLQEKENDQLEDDLFPVRRRAEQSVESAPEMISEAELTEAAVEAMKDQKVSHGEAAEAAAQVAMEIEAKSDAEAQEKPVYQFPPMTMLAEALTAKEDNTEEMRTNVLRLEETLSSFGVDIKIENVVRGPTVTRYEMQLKPGIKMSKITSLHQDIALSLGVSSVRVSAVPGKSSIIGIEVPNRITTSVPIREVLAAREFTGHKSALAFAVGKDIGGNFIVGDISKMPHLLIAGTTGSGKSVCMNSIIVSLLYRASPEQVRLIMIDPKVVELSIYNGIPHLLIPVVTDAKKAAGALQWAVTEMERRYHLLADYKVRDLAGYNKLAKSDPDMAPMPQVVIIIDELADLMLVAAKEVENSIVRIAQKARAAGMHLVIATQRPSSDVITGVMKANIPSRIAFAVSSALESRIILDDSGAEKLVGKGDMLFAPLGTGKPKRVQGCFITDEEVEEVAEFVKNSSEADYSDEIMQQIDQNASDTAGKELSDDDQQTITGVGDALLPDAVEVILDTKQASTSMLQRRLKLGYAHAARIIDEMEEKGIVGPFEGSKPRQLLITREQWNTMVGINPKAVSAAPPVETAEDDVPFDEDV